MVCKAGYGKSAFRLSGFESGGRGSLRAGSRLVAARLELGEIAGRRVRFLLGNNGTGLGWEFKGHVSKWSAGGAGKWSYTVGTQRHYAGCSVVTGCVVHDYPWLQLKVLGNGAWVKTSGTG